MKAAEWIDRVKAAKGIESDYAAAKAIGLSRNAISNYRVGARNTLDEETAVKVAAMLGLKPEGIVIDQVAERSKNPEIRSALLREAKRLQKGVAAVVQLLVIAAFVIVGVLLGGDARAGNIMTAQQASPVCIM